MSATVFEAGRFRVKPLRPEADGAAVDDFAQRCADCTLMLTGEPPSQESGADFFAAAPNGKTPKDMLKLGVFGHAGKLIGLLDIARDHPAPGTWYLGLLLIDPVARGQGLGAAVVALRKRPRAAGQPGSCCRPLLRMSAR